MEVRFPAWRGREKIDLADVLACIPDNEWSWRLLDFSGVVRPDLGVGISELEASIAGSPGGYPLSSSDLTRLVLGIDDSHWVLLVAVLPGEEPSADDLGDDAAYRVESVEDLPGFKRCVLVVRLRDSSDWLMSVPRATEAGASALGEVARRFTRP